MFENFVKPIELKKCLVEDDGTVTCSISKENFDNIQQKNIKFHRVILELE